MNVKKARNQLLTAITRDWLSLTVGAWAATALFYIVTRWAAIHWLALGDTDDNMRLMQVRALLNGQGWYDLRQYRMNPPVGFDIHWSRIVDLPIAGLILMFKPFVGTAQAERLACGIAPLVPLLPAMIALNFTVRRLVDARAWVLAVVFLLGSTVVLYMFAPERIDHHNWQLACLAATVAGLADPKQARGGAVIGLASAISVAIGLEMLPYAVMAGVIVTLRWVLDRGDVVRLEAYALSLTGGIAAGYAGFASYADAVARCDALTPVYLTTLIAAGTFLFVLAQLNPEQTGPRFGLAVLAGGAVAIGFAILFPQCLGRPEQVSPELAFSWLNNVREAKPIYMHPFRLGFTIAALPVVGLIGAIVATWRARGTDRLAVWLPVLLFSAFAAAMLLWQVRAGPAAQLLAIPGAVALAWIVLPWCLNSRLLVVRVVGTVAAFLAVSGMFAGLIVTYLPVDRPDARTKMINKANGQCFALPRLQALDAYPKATIFTFTDLGPRLITTTHHDAVAGPYHRNGDAILDVQHAFTGSDENFRRIAAKHGATLLLLCPNMSESTIYRARAPDGFYGRIANGQFPAFLEPLPLPLGSPFRLYRIRAGD